MELLNEKYLVSSLSQLDLERPKKSTTKAGLIRPSFPLALTPQRSVPRTCGATRAHRPVKAQGGRL